MVSGLVFFAPVEEVFHDGCHMCSGLLLSIGKRLPIRIDSLYIAHILWWAFMQRS